MQKLNHLDIVGWVKALPAVVLHPPTPTLIVLVFDLQKLLTCGETFIFCNIESILKILNSH